MSAATRILQLVEAGGEHYWKPTDFSDASPTAVTKTLSRLTRRGVLQRVGRGLYYHPRPTVIGPSRPSREAILAHRLSKPLQPAGMTAANLLGFSTQNPGRREFATTASAIAFGDENFHVTTRRPESWDQLPAEDAALLDFLRHRGRDSELSAEDTVKRLLTLLRQPGRFERLAAVASTEPPRVRAILGASGQEIGASPELLNQLRTGLKNRRSRFDFGALRQLTYARDWQAKNEAVPAHGL
jgi:hypothetical protein